MEKRKLFFYNTKKKKKTNVFFRRINVYCMCVYIYIYIYLEKKEKVFILNSNTYDLIYNFFKLYPKTFFVNWYEH